MLSISPVRAVTAQDRICARRRAALPSPLRRRERLIDGPSVLSYPGSFSAQSFRPTRAARRFCSARFNRITQAENALGVAIEKLLLVRFRQLEFIQQFEGGRRVPAGIISAVHDVVDAIVLDREFQA